MSRGDQAGWVLFLVSAVLFGWAGLRSGDLLVVSGSAEFGVACALFLRPRAHRAADRQP
jgi:hypothetical protein